MKIAREGIKWKRKAELKSEPRWWDERCMQKKRQIRRALRR